MKKLKVINWLLTALFFSLGIQQKLNAQPLGKLIESTLDSNSPFTIRVLGTEDGIPQHQIASMIRNKKGSLIIGTANGLVEFNGQSFSDINPTDESRKMLCADLYINEKTGILYGLDKKSRLYIISPYTQELFKGENIIAKIVADSLIFITRKNEFRIAKIGSLKSRFIGRITPQKGLISCGITNNAPFYSTDEGTFFLVHGKWKKITPEIYHKSKKDKYSGIDYLIGVNSIGIYKNEKIETQLFQENTAGYLFTDIAFSPSGETYVASHHGIFYRNQKHPIFESINAQIPTKLILSLEYNTDENFLFAGTTNKGLFQIKEKSCISFFDENIINESSMSSIIRNQENKILISGTSSSIFSLNQFVLSKYLNYRTDFSTLAHINGEIWSGTWGSGIYVIEHEKVIRQIKTPFFGSGILAIFQDRKKRIWIGSEKGLAVGKDEKSLHQIVQKQDIGLVICFYQLKNGDIVVGGENGFYIFSENLHLKNQIGIRNGLSGKEVRSFYEKKDGTFYIGTYGGGLYYWDKTKLLSINRMKNCLLDNDIFSLAPDNEGNLYISSNHGLYVINERKIEDFINHKVNFLIPFRVGQDDGILNTEFNGGFQNNYYSPDSKHFYFPSIQGVVICFLDVPKYRKLQPFLKEIAVNDKIKKFTDHVFPRNTHTINLKFYCPNFTNFYNLFYQYKLVGPDLKERWSVPTKKGEISFKMLPPGEYKVYLRGIDGFNDQNPTEISYSFKIEKHVYETLWFRLIAFGLIFLLIFLLTYKRIQISKDQELKESEHKNNMFELKLKAIQAKMNPHFIFNCLNNIQYLIVMGKQEEAEFALSDFSGLLRKFLQQSDHSFISLRDEVALLKSYISVERFRFEEGLNVEVKIPEHLLHLKIPTLLIQPTVENAIVHGLAHKKGDKKLIIEGYKEDDCIILKIDDNGIGRQEAKRINTYRANHISHGWNMVLDKINLLKAKYQYSVIFEIIDKPDNSGTIVSFKIPLVNDEMLEN
jgi:hypothetical protein